jgi:hypothetical protein
MAVKKTQEPEVKKSKGLDPVSVLLGVIGGVLGLLSVQYCLLSSSKSMPSIGECYWREDFKRYYWVSDTDSERNNVHLVKVDEFLEVENISLEHLHLEYKKVEKLGCLKEEIDIIKHQIKTNSLIQTK